MSRRTPHKKITRKSPVWTPNMGPGYYDFDKGEFTPAEAAVDTATDTEAAGPPAAASEPDAAQVNPPSAEPEPTTVVYDVPGRDEPMTFTGDKAMPGFENLSFKELAQLAGMAGIPTPPGTDQALEGIVVDEEIVAARNLLDEAADRGEDPLDMAHAYTYLDGVHKALGRQVKRTRERAEKLFAATQLLHGTKSLSVNVDDGGAAAATVHIQDIKPEIIWDMGAVKAYCKKHATTEISQEVLPGALDLPDVVAFIAMTHPDYVRTKVREAYMTRLQSEIDEEGCKADPNTGELVKLATIRPGQRTGAFILRYANAKNGALGGKQRIEKLFRDGGMGDILALGAAPEADSDEPAAGKA